MDAQKNRLNNTPINRYTPNTEPLDESGQSKLFYKYLIE